MKKPDCRCICTISNDFVLFFSNVPIRFTIINPFGRIPWNTSLSTAILMSISDLPLGQATPRKESVLHNQLYDPYLISNHIMFHLNSSSKRIIHHLPHHIYFIKHLLMNIIHLVCFSLPEKGILKRITSFDHIWLTF